MAKSAEDLILLNYCARYMLPQIINLQKTAQNSLRRRNIEDIHDIRVASRRIRTCLNIFEHALPNKKLKPWIRDIKAITRSYGRVRDLDVQIDLLDNLNKSNLDKVIQPGIRRVRLRLGQKKAKQEDETKALTSAILESPTLLEMQAWAESSIQEPVIEPGNSLRLFQTGYTHIQSHLDEFLFFEVFIFDPARMNELHQMRIAAKHLRYTLEIFSELYSSKTDFALDITRKAQQILGDVHDADVWSQFLPKFLQSEEIRVNRFFGNKGPFNRLKPGIEFLLENRKIERERLYKLYLQEWKKWKLKEAWLNLRKIIFLTSLENQNNNQVPPIVNSETPETTN